MFEIFTVTSLVSASKTTSILERQQFNKGTKSHLHQNLCTVSFDDLEETESTGASAQGNDNL